MPQLAHSVLTVIQLYFSYSFLVLLVTVS